MSDLKNSPLGKTVIHSGKYNPDFLFKVSRFEKRQELRIHDVALPFYGEDLWTGYEISWLSPSGRPEAAIAEWSIPADSPCIAESKSIKIYLNSFNQTVFESWRHVADTIAKDLANIVGKPVEVKLFSLDDYVTVRPVTIFDGICLDRQSLVVTEYENNVNLLQVQSKEIAHEVVYSDLLKSNCLVTNQPDWGSVQIEYTGAKIDHDALLRYLLGFRLHNEFHEQCVERIFMDIWRACSPQMLTVYARYTRRGGLDINPFRSSVPAVAPRIRLVRQ